MLKTLKNFFSVVILLTLIFPVSSVYVRAELSPDDDFSIKEKRAKEGYTIDLQKLIKRSKRKIKTVDDKIKEQAKRRRNQQREAKAREYYNKAMLYTDEGKLKEAQILFQKAIRITEHPEMKDYLGESVRKSKKQEAAFQKEEARRLRRLEIERGYSAQEVQVAYASAVSLFKQKNYLGALEGFELVDEMFPGHKATRSYLQIIEQKIQEDQQRLIEEKLRDEAIARRKEKDQWRRELEQKEKEAERELLDKAEILYQEALKLYKLDEYKQAKVKFNEIEWLKPDYKSTVKYLSHIDRDIEEEERRYSQEQKKQREHEKVMQGLALEAEEERQLKLRAMQEEERIDRLKEEADFLYNAAVSLYKKMFYDEAKGKFYEVQKLFPNYKNTIEYLDKTEAAIQKQEIERKRIAQKELEGRLKAERLAKQRADEVEKRQKEMKKNREAAMLYKSALSFFDNQLYTQALEKFKEVQKVYPNYKSVKKYVLRTEKTIDEVKEREERLKQKRIDAKLEEDYLAEIKGLKEKEKAIKEKEKEEVKREAREQTEERRRKDAERLAELRELEAKERAWREKEKAETKQKARERVEARKKQKAEYRAKIKEEKNMEKKRKEQAKLEARRKVKEAAAKRRREEAERLIKRKEQEWIKRKEELARKLKEKEDVLSFSFPYFFLL